MFRVFIFAVLAFFAYKAFTDYQRKQGSEISQPSPLLDQPRKRDVDVGSVAKYRCDGRTHCSQMTSCEEATFFLKNCPGTKMDGDNDGIPCERQHC